MSREVVGDAPDDAGSLLLREPPEVVRLQTPQNETGTPGARTAKRPRLALTLAGLLCLAAGGGFGWAASGAWGSTTERNDVGAGTAASATVVSMSGHFDNTGLARVDALVRVANVGVLEFTVTGTQTAYLAAQTDPVAEAPARVEPGRSRLLRLAVRLTCGSPLPLSLPPLTVARADGLERPLPVDGATAELARICAAGTASAQTLQLLSATRDGDRLKLVLTVPSGRTVRVVGVSAGQVPLTGRPLPGEVDGQSRTIWLDPPSGCPAAWRAQGIPRALDVALTGVSSSSDVDGIAARLHLDVGYELSAWLLDRACPAGAR